jgi:endoribonuclease LACTB2
MSKHRLATATILTTGSESDPRVLLVERSRKLRFFGGYQAFPGGVIDDVDHDGEPWDALSHRRCAVRECFEEIGVLPVVLADVLDADRRTSLRDGLLADARDSLLEFRALLDAHPSALDGFTDVGVLTTPPFAPVRYQTQFLEYRLPTEAEPELLGGELSAWSLEAPKDVLAAFSRGERLIAPPVLGLLEVMSKGNLHEFRQAARTLCEEHESGRLTRIRNAPGIWMASLATDTIPPATTTNTFLVGESDLWIVDPATPHASEQERLFVLLDELVAEGRNLAGILVTHHHHDHVGAVEATARRFDLVVAAHARTLERLPVPPQHPRELVDGESIDLGDAPDGSPNWILTAYHTPGHDQGHLVFIDSRYRSLIAGDLCSTVSTIVIDPPEGHMATYLDSLARIRDLDIGLLHPSHGPVAPRGKRLIERYIAHRKEREQRLMDGLSDAEGRGIPVLLDAVYPEIDPRIRPVAARSLLAGLQKLQEEQRAVRRDDDWFAVAPSAAQ